MLSVHPATRESSGIATSFLDAKPAVFHIREVTHIAKSSTFLLDVVEYFLSSYQITAAAKNRSGGRVTRNTQTRLVPQILTDSDQPGTALALIHYDFQ